MVYAMPLLLMAVHASRLQPDSLYGTVRGRGKGPIEGAVVTVSRNDSSVVTVLTKRHGRYVARPLMPGVYKIGVAHPDYEQESRTNLGVPDQSVTSIDFELQPKLYGA